MTDEGNSRNKDHLDSPDGARNRDIVRKILQAIKDLSIDGAVAIELEYPTDPAQIVPWVEEAYRETARLMMDVGLRGP